MVDSIRSMLERRGWAICGAATLLIGTALVVVVSCNDSAKQDGTREKRYNARVKRVVSGHSIKLKTGERLNYAGIRTPFPKAPFHDEAETRNRELVDGEKIRLRFDVNQRDSRGRIRAYVFTSDGFINEMLVREGLAYVRLTRTERRFDEELLAAQSDARKHRRGLWQRRRPSNESAYPADPKYGNFHRPDCEEVPKMKPRRKVDFKSAREALDDGYAPCSKCRP